MAQTTLTDLQELVLLSPGMPVTEPTIRHCLVMKYAIYFDSPSASIALMAEDVKLWELSGMVYRQNKVVHFSLPMEARRVSFVANVQKDDWFAIKSVTVHQGECNENMDPGTEL